MPNFGERRTHGLAPFDRRPMGPDSSPSAPRRRQAPADDRRCFEGMLWILWTGAPWSELLRR